MHLDTETLLKKWSAPINSSLWFIHVYVRLSHPLFLLCIIILIKLAWYEHNYIYACTYVANSYAYAYSYDTITIPSLFQLYL